MNVIAVAATLECAIFEHDRACAAEAALDVRANDNYPQAPWGIQRAMDKGPQATAKPGWGKAEEIAWLRETIRTLHQGRMAAADAVADMPATTMGEIRAKAAVLSLLIDRVDMTPELAIAHSLVRDIKALA